MFSSRRIASTILAIVGVVIVGAYEYELPVSEQGVRPNVLLVSVDSLRPDHLGVYGYERQTSPTIDRMASEGVVFETAISASSWTVPAHMTLLSALPPEIHGVTKLSRTLRPEAVTLAEVLQSAGYVTAAFVSGLTVKARYGFAQGFERYDETMVESSKERIHSAVTSPGLVKLVVEYLRRWHAKADPRRPFFIFLHMWDVHYDYDPPAPYDRMFDPHYSGDAAFGEFENNPRIHVRMDPRDLHHLIALYDGEIRYTDEHLGRIVETLHDLEVLDDTIVVVTSDHGEAFFEHGTKGHTKNLYDEVLRIPLVIRYPRRIRPQRVAHQVRLMDVAPTILGLAGIQPPAEFGETASADNRAVDLTPWITTEEAGEPFPRLGAFSHLGRAGQESSIRTAVGKVIRRDRAGARRPTFEIYDLGEDPREKTNLRGTEAGALLAGSLGAALARWSSHLEGRDDLAVARPIGRQHEDRLRALGYVQ